MWAVIDWENLAIIPIGAVGVSLILLVVRGVMRLLDAVFDTTEAKIRDRHKKAGDEGKRRHVLGLEGILEWRMVMEGIRDLPCVERVLVFRASDSGAVPRPGEPYFATCITGFSTDPKAHPEKIYAVPISPDDHYFKLLMTLLERRYTVLTTSEMPPDSMLRSFYEAEGVFQSLGFLLTADEKEMKYCTVANYGRAFAPGEVYRVTMLVNQARGLMGGSQLELPTLPRGK